MTPAHNSALGALAGARIRIVYEHEVYFAVGPTGSVLAVSTSLPPVHAWAMHACAGVRRALLDSAVLAPDPKYQNIEQNLWNHARETAKIVEKWPAWMKDGARTEKVIEMPKYWEKTTPHGSLPPE